MADLKTIEEIAANGEANDVTIRGIVIDIKPGSGLMFRCPTCKRVLLTVEKGQGSRGERIRGRYVIYRSCRVHGSVEGVPDLRVKAAVDDGTGALIAVLDRKCVEKLTGKTMEQYIGLAQAPTGLNDAVRSDLGEKFVASPMLLTGNAKVDDYGLLFIATDAQLVETMIPMEKLMG